MAYLLAGKYETAVTLFRERIVLVPRTDFSRAPLASALGHLGEVDEARRVWRELMEINPKYSFSEHFGRLPFQRQEDVRRIVDGLAKAGLFDLSTAPISFPHRPVMTGSDILPVKTYKYP